MSRGAAGLEPAARPAGLRRGARWRALRVLAALLVLAAVLAAGIALGMSLHDNPRPTGPLTVERTIDPAP